MSRDPDSVEVLFLGTGAADWPLPYCPPADRGQVDAYRGRSSVLVDGHILIDCGATVPDAIRHFGVDVDAITDILLTHSHGDHCDAAAIEHLVSMGTRGDPINLWAHPSALAKLAGIDRLRKRELQPGKTVGFSSLAVTALPANHQVPEDTALHFLLQKPKASLLYATDGAWFLKGAWILLKEVKIDALLWDATCGEAQGDWRIFEHNSVDMIRVMRQTLEKQGVLSPTVKIYLTHLSMNLCAPHNDLVARLVPEGLIPAHDGLSITVHR